MNLKRIAQIIESKNDLIINEVVLNKAEQENQIIHGARAYNYQSPDYLKKKTYDYDIFTKKPKKVAQDVAKILSRRLNREVNVVKGAHKGTYKVKLGKETIVDYTQLKSKPKIKKIWGTEVKSIQSIKRNASRLIKRKDTEFRRQKDLDTLNRIREIEELEKRFQF